MKLLRVIQPAVLIACSAFLTHGTVCAQDESAAQWPTIRLEVRSADRAAVSSNSDYRVHLHLKSESLSRFSPLPNSAASKDVLAKLSHFRPNPVDLAPAGAASLPVVPPPGFYPDDLSSPFGGPVVTSAQSHPIYVNCDYTCWGNPAKFLSNLGQSSFIHVADQYVGSTADNRYTVGMAASISYPILTVLSDNDVLQIVHAAASVIGTGYGHIYHVFLPKHVDECFAESNECYSPDSPPNFYFCAYHASVTFGDIGHVLYTVEPYQNVRECAELQPSPNGGLIDSTSSTLGHELFETITDPDPPTGWIAVTSYGVFGEEIGDLCEGVDLFGPFFEDPISVINGKNYEVQPMYSNTYHACSFAP